MVSQIWRADASVQTLANRVFQSEFLVNLTLLMMLAFAIMMVLARLYAAQG